MGWLFFLIAIVVIGLVVWFIVWFLKRSYALYAEKWTPLAAIVSGTHKGSRMNGTYQGRPVRARINAVGDSEGGSTTYYFEIDLAARPGGRDWKVTYGGEKLLGFGERHWHVATKDDMLKQRLNGAGIVSEMTSWGSYPTISYKAKNGEFSYQEQVGGMYDLPSPERFSAQLELLARFAHVNEQVNAA